MLKALCFGVAQPIDSLAAVVELNKLVDIVI